MKVLLISLGVGAGAVVGLLYGLSVFINYYDEMEQAAIEDDLY